ncbi:hypothetical protein [Stenotrophomonas sp. PS02289]|uniref:hypothetical protein n=1 Tax=Stenotrophomonas sp. PS02289 TaxID=2991422 RepID=UPI00249B8344|nr:hypothetical protein [Stenotrophomonas sp. PS02289]
MTKSRLSALLALAMAASPLASAEPTTSPLPGQLPERVAPAKHCMDTRAIREMNQVSDTSVSLRAADLSTWRVTFKESCPGVTYATNPRIVGDDSWVCGTGKERVLLDNSECGIASVQRITPREFAVEARQADRAKLPMLAAVNVKEEKRTLRGSPSYCFDTRNVRGYGDDVKGFMVQTNAKRSGGHSKYVVEVGANCRALVRSPEIQFRSGFGTSMICGNPGDVVVVNDPVNYPPFAEDYFLDRNEGLRKADIGVGDRCDVLAVYPAG